MASDDGGAAVFVFPLFVASATLTDKPRIFQCFDDIASFGHVFLYTFAHKKVNLKMLDRI